MAAPANEASRHPARPEAGWNPDISAWQAARSRSRVPRHVDRGGPRPPRARPGRPPTRPGDSILAALLRGVTSGMAVSVALELLRVATLADDASGSSSGLHARERIFGITQTFALFSAARAASVDCSAAARRQTQALLAGAWGTAAGYAVGLAVQAARPGGVGTADTAVTAALTCGALAAGAAWWVGFENPAAARRRRLARRARLHAIA